MLAAGDRGVLDLLGVTLRVRRHQQADDFQRAGYFAGLQIGAEPPLVWLVAPSLCFHPATDKLLRYLSSGIRATRIGVNKNWRREVKVVFRQ